MSYEGKTYEIAFNEYDEYDSDNGSGGVWEWLNVAVTENILDFLRDFAKSPDAKMRLTGKYEKTRTLAWNEKQGIIDVINGYDALKSVE